MNTHEIEGAHLCRHCGGARTIRHGYTNKKKQRWRCHDCLRCSVDSPGSAAYDSERRHQLLELYRLGDFWSIRSACRFHAISRNTLTRWIRRSQQPGYDYPHAVAIRPHGRPVQFEAWEWFKRNEHLMVEVDEVPDHEVPRHQVPYLLALEEWVRRFDEQWAQ